MVKPFALLSNVRPVYSAICVPLRRRRTQSLLAARDLAGRHFASWREYAASHVAGAALAGPAEETAARFEQLLPAVATLLLSPESPWRNLEFPIVTDFDALLGVGAHDPDCPDKPFFPDDPED